MSTPLIDPNDPAFPTIAEPFLEGPQGRQPASAWGMEGKPGMSMRAYFAGLAMQMFVQRNGNYPALGENSVMAADNLIAALNKKL